MLFKSIVLLDCFLSICFCNVYSLCCTVQCVQYRVVSCGWARSSQHTPYCQWLASVAGMTRMGPETCEAPGEDTISASPSSSPAASSKRSSSVIYSVLVSLVSVILIASLPTQVLSHKQCSHYYPRDDQVSSLKYFCQRQFFLRTLCWNISSQCHPWSLHPSVSSPGQAGSICPLMWPRSWLLCVHWLGGLLHADM